MRCPNHKVRRALVAFLVFSIGEWASYIALLVWAFDRRGVAGASAIALIQLVPSALLAPVGAMVSNRFSRARALVAGIGGAFLVSGVLLPLVTLLTIGGLRRLDAEAVVPEG